MDPILPETIPNNPPQQEVPPTPPAVSSIGAETAPNTAPEQPQEGPPSPALPTTPVATAQPVVPVDPQSAPAPASATGNPIVDDPIIADDVDVIEKEWVDKAKKIVNATKEDPYQQEKEVSKLQADYLMKRYNKQVKLSE